jgi:hypothetical protein
MNRTFSMNKGCMKCVENLKGLRTRKSSLEDILQWILRKWVVNWIEMIQDKVQ